MNFGGEGMKGVGRRKGRDRRKGEAVLTCDVLKKTYFEKVV